MNIGNGPGRARGIRSGLLAGFGGSQLTGVTRDATSLKYMPATAGEWTTTATAAGITAATSAYTFQAASGNVPDTIGAATLTAAGVGLSYQQTVSGWTTKGITFTQAGTNKLSTTVGAGNTTSLAMLIYVAINSTPGATRSVIEHPNMFTEITATPRYQANGNSLITGTVNPGTTVHPVLMLSDVNASRLRLYTDDENINPGWFSAAGTTLTVGGSTSNGPPMSVVYGAMWSGAPAQMTDNQIRTLLQTLGWNVAW